MLNVTASDKSWFEGWHPTAATMFRISLSPVTQHQSLCCYMFIGSIKTEGLSGHQI